jgi:V/A-type H+-transporting ATPase subunit E
MIRAGAGDAMSIEQIVRKIDEDAEKAAGSVVEQARAQARSIVERYEAAAGMLRSEFEDLADRKAAEEERRLLVSEELELRKAVLVRKREILAGIYDEAKRTIGRLTGEEYLDLLASMIAARAVSGREQIVPAAGQRSLLGERFLARVGEAFGGDARFNVVGEEGTFAWGVVLREGRRIVDLSLDTVFEQVRELVEPEVAAILFAGEPED